MIRCLIGTLLLFAISASGRALAQDRTSGSGLGGASGFGAGGAGGSTFGTGGLGGAGGFGTGGGLGTGGLGNSNLSGGASGTQIGQGSTTGFDVFNPTDQGFVGRDSADADALMQAQAAAIQQAIEQRRSDAQLNRGRDSNQQSRVRPSIRVQLQIAFDYPRPAVAQVNSRLSTVFDRTLNKALAPRGISVPELEWSGRNVTIRGNVPDDDAKRLIENMVKLQPGVDRVDNQLAIVAAEAEPVPVGSPN